MALSCSTQIIQRTWQVYFRQGTLCLASSLTNAGFRGRALRSSSTYALRSHCYTPRFAPSFWRGRPAAPVLGFRSIRALSAASGNSGQGQDPSSVVVEASPSSTQEGQAKIDASDVQEDSKVASSAVLAAEEREEEPEAAADLNLQQEISEKNHTEELRSIGSGATFVDEEAEDAVSTDDFLDKIDAGHMETDAAHASPEAPKEKHPWPEWHKFLNMLEVGKHFDFETETMDTRVERELEDDAGRIKRASMAFARHRDDILSFLSEKPLRVLAEFGCPGIDRKVVNAGKRLRVSLDIAEVSVCQPCDIRNACARAYNKPSNNETAGTQDVIRLLVGYATLAKAQNRVLPGDVEAAAKKLLMEVVRASETPRDPSLPPARQPDNKPREDKGSRRSAFKETAEVKPGDWKCPKCSYVNFSRNSECRECQTGRPIQELPPGDWQCSECNFINFSRNIVCRRCNAKHTGQHSGHEMKEGDWECPRCKFHNFARNRECYECQTERPRGTSRSFDRGDSFPRRSGDRERESSRPSYGRMEERGRSSYGRPEERAPPPYERSSDRGRPKYSRSEERGRPSYDDAEERGVGRFERGRPQYARSEERGRPSYDRTEESGPPGRFDRDQNAVGRRTKHEEWKPARSETKTSRFNFDASDDSDFEFGSVITSDEDSEELDFGSEEEDGDFRERRGPPGNGAKRGRGGDNWPGSAGKLSVGRSSDRGRSSHERDVSFGSDNDEEFGDLDFGDDTDDEDFVPRAVSSSRGGSGREVSRGRGGGRGGRGGGFSSRDSGAGRSRDSWSSDGNRESRGRPRDVWTPDGGRDASWDGGRDSYRRGSDDSWSSDRDRPSRGRGGGGRGGGGRGGRGSGRSSSSFGGRGGRGGGRGGRGGGGRGGRGRGR